MPLNPSSIAAIEGGDVAPQAPPRRRKSGPRSGTRDAPYVRSDGRAMVKIGVSVTKAFADDLRVFAAQWQREDRNQWIERVLRNEMERQMRRRGAAGMLGRGDAEPQASGDAREAG